jgi:hypothetical protein
VKLEVAIDGGKVLNGNLTASIAESAKSAEVFIPRRRISRQSFQEKRNTGLKAAIKNTIIVREIRRFFLFILLPSS